jgi:hypothetical protein
MDAVRNVQPVSGEIRSDEAAAPPCLLKGNVNGVRRATQRGAEFLEEQLGPRGFSYIDRVPEYWLSV